MNDIQNSETITPKENVISKMLSKWMMLSNTYRVLTAITFFVLLGTVFYYSVFKYAKIALIENYPITPPYSSSTPIPSIYPSPTPSTICISRVKTASISKPCATDGFIDIRYQCDDGRSFTLGDGKKCLNLMNAANEASQKCGTLCTVVKPSATPSPSSKLSPSSTPIPLPPKGN